MTRLGDSVRIVFIIGTAHMGGAESQMVRLACALKARRLDVRVLFSSGGGPLTAVLDAGSVPWVVLRRSDFPPTSTGRNIFAALRLARELRRCHPDIVFAWLAQVIWLALPVAALVTRSRRIAAFRGKVDPEDLGPRGRILKLAVSRAHAVTINARHLEKVARYWGADPKTIEFIPNAVDLPTALADVTRQPPVAVVVSNFRSYKGHDVLMKALALVEPKVTVRLLGEGATRAATEDLSRELNGGARVEFVEHATDVTAELLQAQFAIHPSRTEGLPNAILEELAAGLPVVATDVGGTSLLVESGVTGTLVPPNDPVAMAEAITTMASGTADRARMSASARSRAEAFSWALCVATYEDLFNRLVAQGQR